MSNQIRRRHEEVSAQLLRAVADGAPAHVIDDLRVRVRRLAQQINAVAVNPGHRPRHRGPLNQNPRPLGGRASMDTRFGDTIDPGEVDQVGGRRGRDLDGAMSRYNVFHAKEPIRVAELEHDLPRRWKVVGDALAVMYRTDKWKADGTDEDYKHLHDKGDDRPYSVGKGVRLYEPTSGAGTVLPRPEAITLLGYCLGAFVRLDKDGQEYETNPRGSYLFSAPDGHTLWIYSPEKQRDGSSGFLAAFNGGNLRVLKDGIDG